MGVRGDSVAEGVWSREDRRQPARVDLQRGQEMRKRSDSDGAGNLT
jgi:hypothetical protein